MDNVMFLDGIAGSLNAIYDEVKGKLKEFNDSESVWTVIMNFIHSVNWSERWIQAILSCHVVLIVLAISTRHNLPVQLAVFALGATVIFFSENLNALGGEYWEEFASQPYFDKNGIFFTAVLSGPLLLLLLFVLVNYLIHVVGVMVQMKAKQLQVQARQRAKAAAQQRGASTGGSS